MGKFSKFFGSTLVVAHLVISSHASASVMSELDLIVRFSVAQSLASRTGIPVNEDDVQNLKIVARTANTVVVSSEAKIDTRVFFCVTEVELRGDRSFGLDQTVCHD